MHRAHPPESYLALFASRIDMEIIRFIRFAHVLYRGATYESSSQVQDLRLHCDRNSDFRRDKKQDDVQNSYIYATF